MDNLLNFCMLYKNIRNYNHLHINRKVHIIRSTKRLSTNVIYNKQFNTLIIKPSYFHQQYFTIKSVIYK